MTDPFNFTVDGIIYWESKKTGRLVYFEDEVEKEELKFWIEPKYGLDIYSLLLKNTKENMAYRNKIFIEGYPFIVQFEMVAVKS